MGILSFLDKTTLFLYNDLHRQKPHHEKAHVQEQGAIKPNEMKAFNILKISIIEGVVCTDNVPVYLHAILWNAI